jgi:superfamily II DNA or RNA helicase
MGETTGIELDPRRLFSRAEVWRAYEIQGQICAHCKRAIPFDLMHGDHIVPWSQGGPTNIENLQALCGSCNLRKGSAPQEVALAHFDVAQLRAGVGEPRIWQQEALPIVLDAIANEPVLLEACPGAGKTNFGLEVAYRLVTLGAISRVLVIVPTIAIADGWQRSASLANPRAPTMPLRSTRDWRPVDPIGESWLGAIFTYQSLFAQTEMFLAHATDPGQRTLVIFDEVHHAGTDAAWGTAAQEAFARGAAAILSMSGTPFRTAKDPIIFVPSEDGNAKPHYTYSYDRAIADGACRPVQFVEARGTTTFRTEDDVVHQVSFDDEELSTLGENRRLRSALEWIEEGSIAEKMLLDANAYLISLRRRGDSDAAGLVVCIDCDHAADVAQHMDSNVLGFRPVVAASQLRDPGDPNPANAIKFFRSSHDPWIVAVNMVSEGVDIPRLRVVVYLTNRLTLLSFRQIVGRVVRKDPANVEDHGRVYVPADPRLVTMAHEITSTTHLLPPPIVIVTDGSEVRRAVIEGEGDDERVQFQTLATVGEQGDAFDTEGHEAQAVLIECARRFIVQQGLTGTDPESLAIAAADAPGLRDALLAMREDV